jgi:hypothetical protein
MTCGGSEIVNPIPTVHNPVASFNDEANENGDTRELEDTACTTCARWSMPVAAGTLSTLALFAVVTYVALEINNAICGDSKSTSTDCKYDLHFINRFAYAALGLFAASTVVVICSLMKAALIDGPIGYMQGGWREAYHHTLRASADTLIAWITGPFLAVKYCYES